MAAATEESEVLGLPFHRIDVGARRLGSDWAGAEGSKRGLPRNQPLIFFKLL
jgi:hypothetical protein